MRVISALSGFLLAGAAVAQSSSCSPTSSDSEVVKFAWALQFLTESFYASTPLNQTFFSSALNSSTAEYATNLKGIQRSNVLGLAAIQQLGTKLPNYSTPTCNFSIPKVADGETYVETAGELEVGVAGALVGLTGYTQSPEVSFLLARLAADHSLHYGYLATSQEGNVFPNSSTNAFFATNSSSLFPAWTPDSVLKSGNSAGRLGSWLGGCVPAPTSSCGNFTIGPLIGTLGLNSTSSTKKGLF